MKPAVSVRKQPISTSGFSPSSDAEQLFAEQAVAEQNDECCSARPRHGDRSASFCAIPFGPACPARTAVGTPADPPGSATGSPPLRDRATRRDRTRTLANGVEEDATVPECCSRVARTGQGAERGAASRRLGLPRGELSGTRIAITICHPSYRRGRTRGPASVSGPSSGRRSRGRELTRPNMPDPWPRTRRRRVDEAGNTRARAARHLAGHRDPPRDPGTRSARPVRRKARAPAGHRGRSTCRAGRASPTEPDEQTTPCPDSERR